MYYYATGLPMSLSEDQGKQTYKYNAKDYVEMHGYDVYDYGFRGYYPAIDRFTAIDPLAERTAWQSPYCYASNNFVNEIDWMGLSMANLTNSYVGSLNWVALDRQGRVMGSGDDGDYHVYIVDDDWNGQYQSLETDRIIGWELPGQNYVIGEYCYYLLSVTNVTISASGGWKVMGGWALMYGPYSVDRSHQINENIGAILHYYFGKGKAIQNGMLTELRFMMSSNYRHMIDDINKGQRNNRKKISFTRKVSQFHIGRTMLYYQVSGKLIIVSIGNNDGFWDPNFIEEAIDTLFLDGSKADGKGDMYELGGTPYDYIPTVIILSF